MTREALTDELAERVMGWRAVPYRFIKSQRSWLPKWRFAPTHDIGHAFQLLTASTPTFYKIEAQNDGRVMVEVEGSQIGRATAKSLANAITIAIARSIGIQVPNELLSNPEKSGRS